MPAIEVHPGQSVGVALTASKRIAAVVSRRTRGDADTLVVLTVWIGELPAGPAELGFDLPSRVLQFAS
jgi:hypothetical protein